MDLRHTGVQDFRERDTYIDVPDALMLRLI
jgi:hypothetical protein